MGKYVSNEVLAKLDALRAQPQAQVNDYVEWAQLVNEARNAGMSPEDVRAALRIMGGSMAMENGVNRRIKEDNEA